MDACAVGPVTQNKVVVLLFSAAGMPNEEILFQTVMCMLNEEVRNSGHLSVCCTDIESSCYAYVYEKPCSFIVE